MEGSWFFEFFGRGVVCRQHSSTEGFFSGEALCRRGSSSKGFFGNSTQCGGVGRRSSVIGLCERDESGAREGGLGWKKGKIRGLCFFKKSEILFLFKKLK